MNARRFAHHGWGRARWMSFRCALRGLRWLLAEQMNARIHAAATVGVAIVGWWLRLSAGEWVAVVLSIALVWTAETLNTAIEHVVDLVSPDEHPLAGKAKDVAAGAVLLASVGAAIVGAVVFVPKIAVLF